MDVGNENIDFIKLINIKGNVDNITPHKIAVVAFIREYGLLKIEGMVSIYFYCHFYFNKITKHFCFSKGHD